MGARLNVRDLAARQDGRDVVRVDSLDIDAGSRLSVLGPNGAGKTTLLRLLAGVQRPTGGQVTIDGINTVDGGVALRRRSAFATQRPGLLATSVWRNVELPLRWRKIPRRQRHERTHAALARLGVAHLAARAAPALSGGEQQRVNLARALAIDPAVLLLDEPESGLDAESRARFLHDLASALADRSTTVVHVSHRPEDATLLADRAATDRIAALIDGHIRQIGAVEQLLVHPADPRVASLVGYDNLVDAEVDEDGIVRVAGEPTGLTHPGSAGPATVAVFAHGIRPSVQGGPGIRARVRRLAHGPGYRTATLAAAGPRADELVMRLPLTEPAPPAGSHIQVTFDPALAAVFAGLPALARTALG